MMMLLTIPESTANASCPYGVVECRSLPSFFCLFIDLLYGRNSNTKRDEKEVMAEGTTFYFLFSPLGTESDPLRVQMGNVIRHIFTVAPR